MYPAQSLRVEHFSLPVPSFLALLTVPVRVPVERVPVPVLARTREELTRTTRPYLLFAHVRKISLIRQRNF